MMPKSINVQRSEWRDPKTGETAPAVRLSAGKFFLILRPKYARKLLDMTHDLLDQMEAEKREAGAKHETASL